MLEAVKKTLGDRGVEYAILSHPTPIRSAEDTAAFLLSLPAVFDHSLLRWDCIYSGTGDLPHLEHLDVKAVNSVVARI